MFITFTTNTKVGGFVNILKDGNQVQSGLEICVLETIHHHSSGMAQTHSHTTPTWETGPRLQTNVLWQIRASFWMPKEDCGASLKHTYFSVLMAAWHGQIRVLSSLRPYFRPLSEYCVQFSYSVSKGIWSCVEKSGKRDQGCCSHHNWKLRDQWVTRGPALTWHVWGFLLFQSVAWAFL